MKIQERRIDWLGAFTTLLRVFAMVDLYTAGRYLFRQRTVGDQNQVIAFLRIQRRLPTHGTVAGISVRARRRTTGLGDLDPTVIARNRTINLQSSNGLGFPREAWRELHSSIEAIQKRYPLTSQHPCLLHQCLTQRVMAANQILIALVQAL